MRSLPSRRRIGSWLAVAFGTRHSRQAGLQVYDSSNAKDAKRYKLWEKYKILTYKLNKYKGNKFECFFFKLHNIGKYDRKKKIPFVKMYKNNIYYCLKYFLNFFVGTLNNRNSKNNFAVNIKICNSLYVRNENSNVWVKKKPSI